MPTPTPLSPTPRTRLTRSKDRAASDRQELVDVLGEAFIAHLGATVGEGATVEGSILGHSADVGKGATVDGLAVLGDRSSVAAGVHLTGGSLDVDEALEADRIGEG